MAAFEVIALDTATPQLRAPGASDTYTFPRAVEMPLGTANGVLYLDGSKVVTSGSVLTFDGAILGVNGVSVGRGAGAVSTNTAVGASALFSNTTAPYNTAVGYQAGYSNTTGTLTALGAITLYGNTTGVANTAVGGYVVGVSYAAMQTNSTGSYNVALGSGALYANTTASNNTAVGYQAGYSNTTGSRNIAIGPLALYYNTTGVSNTAVGSGQTGAATGALGDNTTGSYNTAIGDGALKANTTASNNTAVGYQAGYTNSTGVAITTIGASAGKVTTVNGGTFIGESAGLAATTGTYNTFVGSGCGYLVTTGGKNTLLGAYSGNQGGLDIRTANNYIVLSDGDGNPRWYADSNGTWRTNTTGVQGVVMSQDTGNAAVSSRLFFSNSSGTWAVIASSTDLVFHDGATIGSTTGTARQVFNQYGIGLGGISPTSGTGITFPATQSASSNANTLDDYEEGTFTPTVIGITTAGTATYSAQEGKYTKIGNLVTINVYLNWTGGTGTGALYMAGLPFTSNTYVSCSVIAENIAMTADYIATPRILPTDNKVQFLQLPTGGGNLADINYDSAGNFMLSASYQV